MADRKYAEASLRAQEHFSNKVKTQLNKSATDQGVRFIRLTTIIPNWKTLLTPKQREAAIKYLSAMNAYEVDHQLKLNPGTTHQRLFGSRSSKGAIGRLEEAYKQLEADGYFVQKEKRKVESKQSKFKLTPKALEQMRELFKLIQQNPDYQNLLTKQQITKVELLLEHRSLQKGAKACGITVDSYQQALIGSKGVLEKLKTERDKRTVNSWSEI